MTRNLGTATRSSSSCQYKTHIREHRIKCSKSEDLSNLQSSVLGFPLGVTTNDRSELCKPVSVTSSLLRSEAPGSENGRHNYNYNYRSRRERVCKSWTGGYGTLVEDKESELPGDRVVLISDRQQYLARQKVQAQFCPSALRSTIRRATSLVVATPWKHQTLTADAVPCATKATHRRSWIDLLLMPSLRSLVNRRSSSSRATPAGISASRDRTLLVPGMGGSSSSSLLAAGKGVTAGKSVGDVSALGASASVMVPLMKKEASCSSLAPSITINGKDFRGSGAISDVPSGEQGANGGRNMRKCETMLALSSFGATMQRSASSSRTTIHLEPLRPVNRLRVLPHYSSSGLSPNVGGGSVSRMCSRCSSLLSMASSSRYSLNTAGGGFVPCGPGGNQPDQNFLLCKLCLGDVPSSMAYEIIQCGCAFCKDVSKLCSTTCTVTTLLCFSFSFSSP
jgi:hypothetical protein